MLAPGASCVYSQHAFAVYALGALPEIRYDSTLRAAIGLMADTAYFGLWSRVAPDAWMPAPPPESEPAIDSTRGIATVTSVAARDPGFPQLFPETWSATGYGETVNRPPAPRRT